MRILATTNHHLRAMVQERRFREYLYYGLNVATVDLPPLRQRPDDLLPLAARFLGLHARRLGKSLEGFADDTVAVRQRYQWPGNVRELEHAVQRAVILPTGPEVAPGDLALPLDVPPAASLPLPALTSLADVERHWILTTLERCGGNQSAGIDRTTLHRKLQQYGR